MTTVESFHEQVKQGDVHAIEASLAENPALLDALNAAGQSAFLLAKYYRQESIAALLLRQNPKLDIFNACVAGDIQKVSAELDRQPDLLQARSTDGWTPLHLAGFFGHPDLVNLLLARGAEIEARSTNAMKNTPLHAAAAGGRLPAVRTLLEKDAEVNARQEGGWTALHSAAQAGDRDMVELLVAAGANVQIRADNGQAPLDLALMKGHGEIAQFLESLGAKLQN